MSEEKKFIFLIVEDFVQQIEARPVSGITFEVCFGILKKLIQRVCLTQWKDHTLKWQDKGFEPNIKGHSFGIGEDQSKAQQKTQT